MSYTEKHLYEVFMRKHWVTWGQVDRLQVPFVANYSIHASWVEKSVASLPVVNMSTYSSLTRFKPSAQIWGLVWHWDKWKFLISRWGRKLVFMLISLMRRLDCTSAPDPLLIRAQRNYSSTRVLKSRLKCYFFNFPPKISYSSFMMRMMSYTFKH